MLGVLAGRQVLRAIQVLRLSLSQTDLLALQRHLQVMREDVLAEMVQQIEAEESVGQWVPLLAQIQTCIKAAEAVGRTAAQAPELGAGN